MRYTKLKKLKKLKKYKKQQELIRQKLWMKVVIAYVGSSNSTSLNGAIKWADTILLKFDEKFS